MHSAAGRYTPVPGPAATEPVRPGDLDPSAPSTVRASLSLAVRQSSLTESADSVPSRSPPRLRLLALPDSAT
eukprot:755947-Hanusia_phi.AAC.3